MAINVNGVTATPTQNNASTSNQEVQKTNVQAAQNYGQTNNTATSTQNLYNNSSNNLGKNSLETNIVQQIIKNARLGKNLDSRYLSLFSSNSTTPTLETATLENMYSKLMHLHSSGHLKSLMRSFNRRASRGQSSDQAYGSNHIKDEHADLSEKEKVKRKEGQTINENTINDVLKESLRQHDTPVQRFLLLSMTIQSKESDPVVKKTAQQVLDDLYTNHGVRIRAGVNSLDEAHEYGKNSTDPIKKTTQFQETYYLLIQAQSATQMFSILKECQSITEFEQITNLMHTATSKDKQAIRLPTSDPNTIHNLLTFMSIRTAFRSMMQSADRFTSSNRKAIKSKFDGKSKFSDSLLPPSLPQILI